MSRRILIVTFAGMMLGLGALIAIAQTTQPATQPTTQQAAYDRLLGKNDDRPDRPILPTGKPTIDLTTGNSAIAPGAPQALTQREGSYIKSRLGRLAKAADGQGWEFVFNVDANALQDPPMKVLPNLKLGIMEDQIEANNRDLVFRVTGMVTEYRGRNYVLLENVSILPDVK